MSNKPAIWGLSIDTTGFHLRMPLPLFVLRDLVDAWDDLLEIILPRFGLPNYAAVLRGVLDALIDLPEGMPLLDVDTEGTRVTCAPLAWGGYRQ